MREERGLCDEERRIDGDWGVIPRESIRVRVLSAGTVVSGLWCRCRGCGCGAGVGAVVPVSGLWLWCRCRGCAGADMAEQVSGAVGACAAARGEFAFAYLAWLIYVIACTPKMVLILETSILDLIELKVPLGTTGFKITVMSSVPLLYTLINSVTEDLTGHASYRAQSCYSRTCLDLLDSFTLMEMLLADQIPNATLKYTVTGVYFVSFFIPVLWLYQLNSLQLDYKCVVVRFLASYAVNGPLLVVRCFLVFLYGQQVSVFLFKNVFWLLCDCTELLEGFCTVRRVRKYSAPPVQFTRCISDHEMCAHGYVNTLAVTSQS
eukprot:gi/632961605/ref/XP_007896847.1/ PREDICTED: cat eye syndrome critical region protein 6 [Callorhinchus milii]